MDAIIVFAILFGSLLLGLASLCIYYTYQAFSVHRRT